MSYLELKKELEHYQGLNHNPLTGWKIPDSIDTTTTKDVAGLAKMGFTSLPSAQDFGAARDRNPALKNLFDQIGKQSVLADANGNPLVDAAGNLAPTPYDGFAAALGDKFRQDPKVLDNLAADIQQNPALEGRLLQALNAPGGADAIAKSLPTYSGAPGQLDAVINSAVPSTAPAVEPIAVVAGATAPATPTVTTGAAPAGYSADSAIPAPTAASAALTAADISMDGGLADTMSERLLKIYPDLEPEISAFRKTLKTDKNLQASVAKNLNDHPEFMQELAKMGEGGKDNNATSMMQRYGRDEVKKLLANPSQLADGQYVDDLTKKMQAASNPGGFGAMLGGLMNGLKNFDFGGMLSGLGEMLKPLIDMIGGLFSKLGGGNFMSMGNTDGNMFGNLFSGGERLNRFQLSDANMTARDMNHDGQLSDGMQWLDEAKTKPKMVPAVDDKGKPVMVPVLDKDGHKIPDGTEMVNGKEVQKYKMEQGQMQQYLASQDDRVTVTDGKGKEQRVFLSNEQTYMTGKNGEQRVAFVTEINRNTGVATASKVLTVNDDGSFQYKHEDEAAVTVPKPPEPANQQLASQNNMNNLNHAAPAAGPGGQPKG